MKRFLFLLPMALILGACAPGPASIAPVSMGNAYDSMSCAQAQSLLNAERPILAALEQQQRNAVAGDAIGVFLVLVPVSTLIGANKAGEVGASKGKVLALETRLQRC